MIKREKIINYIKEKYDANPEYLWDDTPDAAIFRHKNNKKWFALIMNVKNEEYINVKTNPDYSDLLRNTYDYIIPAYHMNKELFLLFYHISNSIIQIRFILINRQRFIIQNRIKTS